ncbi:MAG: outer membrane protein assembly factor BamD [Stygiobacter sp.]
MLKNFRYVLILLSLIILTNCSSSVDTSKFSVDEYFNYAMKLYNDEDYELAIQEFQNFLLQYSGSSFNDDAQYYYAMTYFKRGQYLLAAYEFSKLIRNIPASPFVPEAQFMLAESYYKLAPPYQLDQAYTKKAIEEFQAFIDFFPADKRVAEAERKIKELTERLAEKEYQSGLIYEKMEYEKAAIKYYAFVADTYHDTKFAPLSLYRKIQLEIKKGMKTEAVADINTFLNRYPESEYANEIKKIETQLVEAK